MFFIITMATKVSDSETENSDVKVSEFLFGHIKFKISLIKI